MRRTAFLWIFLIACGPAFAQKRATAVAPPVQFEIGRRTFFDFGPPFNYYDLFIVRSNTSGISIERISLTPPGHWCAQPAKIEDASAFISESIAAILGDTNPCAIPEKELHRELKRCKKCLVFSGAKVAMKVQCGSQVRIIRSDILDRDMFDPAAKTPQHTAWTMQLLQLLDKAVGPGMMEKPVFPNDQSPAPPLKDPDSRILQDVGAGNYDTLFPDAPEKPSDLYRASQNHRPLVPSVQLLSSQPTAPEVFVAPAYPPMAEKGEMQGTVFFTISVDASGNVIELTFDRGAPIFEAAVRRASAGWKFPPNLVIPWIRAAIRFSLECGP
jgi:TonB family protein